MKMLKEDIYHRDPFYTQKCAKKIMQVNFGAKLYGPYTTELHLQISIFDYYINIFFDQYLVLQKIQI